MKKSFVTLVLVVVLAFALLASASAASFEHLADELNALGLFRGTGDGYDLERAPNRGEALVMLIRLYGLEEEALACESDVPFTDVSGWLVPYVAFAYENGFTTGKTATAYGPTDLCTAQMYVTFVLRALDYRDGDNGDFAYAKAVEFGMQKGIIDETINDGEFLRDQMVAVSYLALQAEPNGGEYDTLLDKLVAEGAVNATAAASLAGKQAIMQEFMNAGLNLGDETRVAMNMNMKADIGPLGGISAKMDAGVDFGEDALSAMVLEVDMMGRKMVTETYTVDGVQYTNNDGVKTKMAVDADADPSGMEGMLPLEGLTGFISIPPYIFSEVTKETQGDLTVYKIKIADSLIASMMDGVTGLIGGFDSGDMDLGALGLGGISPEDMDLSIKSHSIEYYADASGALKKISVVINMSMSMDMMGIKIPVPISISVTLEITAVGDAVEIVFPDDLDTYIDVSELVPPDAGGGE